MWRALKRATALPVTSNNSVRQLSSLCAFESVRRETHSVSMPSSCVCASRASEERDDQDNSSHRTIGNRRERAYVEYALSTGAKRLAVRNSVCLCWADVDFDEAGGE